MSEDVLDGKAKEKPLYGPEGSSEGKVDPNTHKVLHCLGTLFLLGIDINEHGL